MDILPAIDLRDGKVVRLVRGDYDRETTYSHDPVAVAEQFVAAGTSWIHMVDLDAARTGERTNRASVAAVCQAVPAKIQLGGGARDEAAIKAMFETGVARVVVGSKALSDWAWFEQLISRDDVAGKIALGLDAREGKLAAHGWTQETNLSAVELARRTKGWSLGAIVYTDIARDGMLQGVSAEATAEIVDATDVPVIASGGVCCLEDVVRCREIGCAGAIIGRAWYERRIDLAQAIRLASQ